MCSCKWTTQRDTRKQCLVRNNSRVEFPTDQGTSFTSRTLCRPYDMLGILTSVYSPQTDGLVERFNQTLKNMMHKFIRDDAQNRDNWLDHLQSLTNTVATCPQETWGNFSLFLVSKEKRKSAPADVLRNLYFKSQFFLQEKHRRAVFYSSNCRL